MQIEHPKEVAMRRIKGNTAFLMLVGLATIGLAALLSHAVSFAQAVSFGPATNFAVGTSPFSVAIGDLNGDGNPDLAVANFHFFLGNNVSILLGTGTGAFGAATNFPVGSQPISAAIEDFNADGKLDLAVANQSGNTISILLGDGTGSFGAATNFPVGTSPTSIAVGDFNGDGKPDLAVANLNSNNVSILLGTGTGAFGAATNFPVGTRPASVAMGDFNGDGNPDLATANRDSNNVSILLGTGTGAFGAPTNFTVGSVPRSVAIGDFNGDGNADLATANQSGNNVSILLGTGTGSFGVSTSFALGTPPASVAIGDFNGDGNADLAVTNQSTSSVSMLLGTGTGTFGIPTNFPVGANPVFAAIGDFNGDGRPDLAVVNFTSNNVSILLNTTMPPNQAPVAQCKNVTVNTTLNFCSAAASINNGSFDPDGVISTLAQLPAGPYSKGTTIVTLTVTDDDGASNSCTGTVTVVDNQAPAITCPVDQVIDATGPSGAVVTFTPTVSDNCDGAMVVGSTPASGSTFPIGSTAVSCSATDGSGNSSFCGFTVSVTAAAGQISNLIATIQAFNLKQGIANSLDSKLQNTLAALNAAQGGSAAATCNLLTAFINETQAQSGKALTVDQANQLITSASRITAVIGCP